MHSYRFLETEEIQEKSWKSWIAMEFLFKSWNVERGNRWWRFRRKFRRSLIHSFSRKKYKIDPGIVREPWSIILAENGRKSWDSRSNTSIVFLWQHRSRAATISRALCHNLRLRRMASKNSHNIGTIIIRNKCCGLRGVPRGHFSSSFFVSLCIP